MRSKLSPRNYTIIYGIVVFVLLVIIPFIALDADYSPLRRWGDCADEGYWIHNARLKIVFGHFQMDELNQAVYGSPLFNFLLYLSFKLFGISLFSSRLIGTCSFIISVGL